MYVRIWHGEQMSLQTPAKGVQQWWRWCDLRWQIVPDLGTSNRKGSVANGEPVGLWLDEAASVGGAKSSSTRLVGHTDEWTKVRWRATMEDLVHKYGHFKLDALRNAQPMSDIWSEHRKPKISRAAAFKTDCRRRDRCITGFLYLSTTGVQISGTCTRTRPCHCTLARSWWTHRGAYSLILVPVSC